MAKYIFLLTFLVSACVIKEDRVYRNITIYCNNAPPLAVDSVYYTGVYTEHDVSRLSIHYVQNDEDRYFSDSATCNIRGQ